MADKMVAKISGQNSKASSGGGGTTGNPRVKKTKGTGNKSVAAISPKGKVKRVGGQTKQNAGHLVKQTPKTTQGQRGKPGPAMKASKVRGAKASKGY